MDGNLAFASVEPNDLGVAYQVSVDQLTGAARLAVPVPLPPGRAGFHPECGLHYASSAGNSAFGAGWSLSGVTAIGVDDRRGHPRYGGPAKYTAGGAELVPTDRVIDRDGTVVRCFRARFETDFTRYEHVTDTATGWLSWRARHADGTMSVFGAVASGASRITDGERVYQWLLEARYDPFGNAIRYEYVRDDLTNVQRGQSFERHRLDGAAASTTRYLKSVHYGNTVPIPPPARPDEPHPDGNRWLFGVVFDYGDHSDPADGPPPVVPDRAWPVRPDPFSTHRPGFELRTYRLCRRILVFADIPELGDGATLLGAMRLEHNLDPAGSQLRRVLWTGYRRGGDARTKPPLSFTYTPARLSTELRPIDAESARNLPQGLSGSREQAIDLYSEGLPGVLTETADAWYYKPNLGDGRLGAQQRVASKPAAVRGGPAAGAFALRDFDRDGNPNLVLLDGESSGYYEYDRDDQRWRSFVPFRCGARWAGDGRRAWVDIDGDGRPDLVVAHPDRLVYFRSLGKDGFAAPQTLCGPAAGSAPMLAERPDVDVFFADMTGDGMLALVRVVAGRVEYWPHTGNGQLGQPVLMDGELDVGPEPFDSRRLRFVSLTGNHTTDLLYLGNGEVRWWRNESGNRIREGGRLTGLPVFDNLSAVQVLDFLGDGTPCLVWSSALPGDAGAPLAYLRLTDGSRPQLLSTVDNGRGARTTLSYSSSARHYVRDRVAGTPWQTTLPSHPIVVDRLEAHDLVTGGRNVSRYEYRNGCFDTAERMFRGFLHVDRYDTAEYVGAAPSTAPSTAPPDADLTTPTCVRTWHHPGRFAAERSSLADAWTGDPFQMVPAPSGPESPSTLDDASFADAYRTLAGRVVREEVFAVGLDGRRAAHPYSVTSRAYAARLLQPPHERGSDDAVLYAYQREAITAVYEQQPDDPRVTASTALEVDHYGQLVRLRETAYPRRVPDPEVPEQARHIVTETETTFVHLDTDHRYVVGLPVQSRDFALDTVDGPATLTGWERTFYCNDGGTDALPFGDVGETVLPHHERAACFTPALIADVFGDLVDDAMLRQDGRYHFADGYWWQPGPVHHHLGADRFRLLDRVEQPDGAVVRLRYDPHDLAIVALEDAATNTCRAELDYHMLAPWRITDANDNVREVRYDPLGVAVVSTSYGHVRGADGAEQPYGALPLANHAATPGPSTVDDVLADPLRYLQRAMRYTHHDTDAWTARGEPPASIVLTREELVQDGAGGGTDTGRVHIAVAYFDGFGRPAQSKQLADGDRWWSNGHVAHDAKQQPVRRYDPYFTGGPGYDPDPELWIHGAVTRIAYDGAGRVIREEWPNGTQSRTDYAAWSTRFEDANDTVATSRYRLEREGLPAADPDRQALDKALAHADTPTVLHLDPLGREVLRVEHGTGGARRRTASRLDHGGRTLAATDPRGLVALRYDRDLLGRELRERSVDAGTRRSLPDAMDRTAHTWSALGVHIHTRYDRLGRATEVTARGRGLDQVVERFTYGDQPGAIADPERRNARGRLIRHEDQAGLYTVEGFTPDGEVLRSARQLRTAIDTEPDWDAGEELESTAYVSAARYDATGRVVWQRLPDSSVREFEHARHGGVRRVTVDIDDGDGAGPVEILAAASYDANGRRATVRLGNGAETTYAYDRDTLLLRRLTTDVGATTLQDVEFTRDPVGNITRALDHAQQPTAATPLLTGATVGAQRDFTYDAFYRLVEATGRVHQALLEHDWAGSAPGTVKGTRHLTLTNGAALERYTQSYRYDLGGNLEQIRHAGATRTWRTDIWTSATSNRSLPALDATGLAVSTPEDRFDAAGNTLVLPHLRRLDWSYRHAPSRAVIVDRAASGEATRPDDDERYVYAADGTRVRKVTRRLVSGEVEQTEVLYLDGCELRRVRRGAVTTLSRITSHITDGTARVATIHRWSTDTDGLETDAPGQRRIDYEVPDQQGSVALVLDEAGAVASYEEHFPFGGTALLAGPAVRALRRRDHRFTGARRDDATGLYSFRYRYYAPWIGGWLSPDPAGPRDSLNLYEYCRNNPVNLEDPDGLQATGTLRRLGGVDANYTERQAIDAFNAGRGLELGIWVKDLRRYGENDWEIVDWEPMPPRLAELIRERGDAGSAQVIYDVEQMFAQMPSLALPPGFADLGRDQSAVDSPQPPGDPAATQTNPPGPPGDARVQGADGRQADAPSSTAKDRSATATAHGTGAQGDGPGAGRQGDGTGGVGGTGARGPSGTGPGGTGDAGPGGGRGRGAQPGGGTGATGVAGGAADGGVPGGTSATGADGAPTGGPDGVETGVLGGVPGGVPGGVVGGSVDAPATTGGVPSTGSGPLGGTDPNGSSTGSPDGAVGGVGGVGGADGQGSGQRPTAGTPAGGSGAGSGGTGGTGGERGGGGQSTAPRTTLDKIVQYAGYWHLEFGGDGGVSGGIPGGMDLFNLGLHGAGWQIAFLALTAVDIVTTVLSLGQLKAAMVGLKAGLRKLVTQAKHLVPAALKWGRRTLDDLVGFVLRRHYQTFFSVQNAQDVVRLLRNGGLPWPQGFTNGSLRDIFGQGLYTFANRASAEAYLAMLRRRGVDGLQILAHRISGKDLAKLRHADLTTMTDDAANAILDLGTNHGFERITRMTGNFGVEDFFRNDVYRLFRSWVD